MIANLEFYMQISIHQLKYPLEMEAKKNDIFRRKLRGFATAEYTKSNAKENSPGNRKMIPNESKVMQEK